MKFLLLSNVNMEPLVRQLKPRTVVCGPYNSMLADLAASGGLASAADITHVLCFYDTDALMGDAFYGGAEPEQCDAFLDALDSFCARCPDKIVVANTFCLSSSRWLGFADLTHKSSLKAHESRLNARLVSTAKIRRNLLVIDIEVLFRRYGEQSLLSNTFWYAGRIRYSNQMFKLLAETLNRALGAYSQPARKVLALDLDNTLWGGIVGEAGPDGIALSEDGVGRCYRDFQRCLKAVQRTGVLLVAVSKNNAADVDEVFDQNPMMILKREDFAAIRANWTAKVENLTELSETLDLGTDSFVFIDDNPVEREAVKKFMPEVAVPDFPGRIENLATWFQQEIAPVYFARYAVTAEDATKTQQYHARAARQKLAASFDLDGYLAELGIECKIHVDPANTVTRAAQMTQKTNQFTLTARRYNAKDIAQFVESTEHAVLMLDYRDRFGDEGSVALAILDLTEGRIDTFLASCRVIGRKVEQRLLEKAIELCRARGLKSVVGEFVPTRKNQMVSKFYEDHGFTRLDSQPDGTVLYERTLNVG
jgi:FkbH-like protein